MKTYKINLIVEYSKNIELEDDTVEKAIAKFRTALEKELIQDEFIDELYVYSSGAIEAD